MAGGIDGIAIRIIFGVESAKNRFSRLDGPGFQIIEDIGLDVLLLIVGLFDGKEALLEIPQRALC
ncbi:MAG TPA: hypothetical protein VMT46_05185 [Anaerolineaceae bacterium]|nr:hypothetical protein [Anaerolineaceae bacterium]